MRAVLKFSVVNQPNGGGSPDSVWGPLAKEI